TVWRHALPDDDRDKPAERPRRPVLSRWRPHMTRQLLPLPLAATLALVLLATGFAPGATSPAEAAELSAKQIVDGLKAPRTRSLGAQERPALSADDLATLNRIRRTRSLSSADRAEMAEIA